MLPKSERLTKQDFAKARLRTVFRGTYADIAVAPAETSRFACVISKKRIKRAVDRNKAKRKIYHMLRTIKPATPHLVVVYPKQNILSGNRALIEEELLHAFVTL